MTMILPLRELDYSICSENSHPVKYGEKVGKVFAGMVILRQPSFAEQDHMTQFM